MRQVIAFPFLLLAKVFAWMANQLDTVPVVCLSLRDSTEITGDPLIGLLGETSVSKEERLFVFEEKELD